MTQAGGATALSEGGRPERPTERRSLPARVSLYYRQVVAELHKVIWPTRKELVTYTSVVIVFVLAVIAFVSLLDLALGQVVFWVFG